MGLYADVIIDISHSRLDRTYQYRIPVQLQDTLEPGNVVEVPFGRGDKRLRVMCCASRTMLPARRKS